MAKGPLHSSVQSHDFTPHATAWPTPGQRSMDASAETVEPEMVKRAGTVLLYEGGKRGKKGGGKKKKEGEEKRRGEGRNLKQEM